MKSTKSQLFLGIGRQPLQACTLLSACKILLSKILSLRSRELIFVGENGAWFSGTSVSFMYVLENGQVPNQITLDNVLDEVNAKDVRLSLETPFTCSDFRVVVR